MPGIENCVAEKQLDRRTSCLQSNINFLKSALTSEVAKARADAQAKVDEARKQITALQLVINGLQEEIRKLREQADANKPKTPPAGAAPPATPSK